MDDRFRILNETFRCRGIPAPVRKTGQLGLPYELVSLGRAVVGGDSAERSAVG